MSNPNSPPDQTASSENAEGNLPAEHPTVPQNSKDDLDKVFESLLVELDELPDDFPDGYPNDYQDDGFLKELIEKACHEHGLVNENPLIASQSGAEGHENIFVPIEGNTVAGGQESDANAKVNDLEENCDFFAENIAARHHGATAEENNAAVRGEIAGPSVDRGSLNEARIENLIEIVTRPTNDKRFQRKFMDFQLAITASSASIGLELVKLARDVILTAYERGWPQLKDQEPHPKQDQVQDNEDNQGAVVNRRIGEARFFTFTNILDEFEKNYNERLSK